MAPQIYHALIRTHHITSRKKVAALKAAAKRLNVQALLRSGGVPGVMYVEGTSQEAVQDWVNVVHGLRYKDYQLAARAQSQQHDKASELNIGSEHSPAPGELTEVDTVKGMGAIMEQKGLAQWWKTAMGYVRSE